LPDDIDWDSFGINPEELFASFNDNQNKLDSSLNNPFQNLKISNKIQDEK